MLEIRPDESPRSLSSWEGDIIITKLKEILQGHQESYQQSLIWGKSKTASMLKIWPNESPPERRVGLQLEVEKGKTRGLDC